MEIPSNWACESAPLTLFRSDRIRTIGTRQSRARHSGRLQRLPPLPIRVRGKPGSPTQHDLTEPLRLVELCAELGVKLLNVTAGSPYYNPHIQRPAAYPPSDGYQPPEDPLAGVARQIQVTRQLKAAAPPPWSSSAPPTVTSRNTSRTSLKPSSAKLDRCRGRGPHGALLPGLARRCRPRRAAESTARICRNLQTIAPQKLKQGPGTAADQRLLPGVSMTFYEDAVGPHLSKNLRSIPKPLKQIKKEHPCTL
jgi:hypothetical protein